MRILLLHPNYHSGGAEIARNWPPAWAAFIAGALKSVGYANVTFIDAMTFDIPDDTLEVMVREAHPDIVMATAITPAIYKAMSTLEMVRRVFPGIPTVLGGVHGTFMYRQVFTEAPWIDVIVRGEGERVVVHLVKAIEAGDFATRRHVARGIACVDESGVTTTLAGPPIQDLDVFVPDWGVHERPEYDTTQLPVLDEVQQVFTNDEFHPKRRSVNKRPTAREVRACGGPDDRAVATIEAGGQETETVGGYIALAIRASEVEAARMMGCPTVLHYHPQRPAA